jgi:predicted Fe-Mo cluster-binding NifX family protein
MKLALSVFKDCISTVFDSADQLLIVEADTANPDKRTLLKFVATDPAARAAELKNRGVDVLICGAISRPMQALIMAQGIIVHPFVRGEVHAIITAYRNNTLGLPVFSLPGCRRRAMGAGLCRQRGMRYRSR